MAGYATGTVPTIVIINDFPVWLKVNGNSFSRSNHLWSAFTHLRLSQSPRSVQEPGRTNGLVFLAGPEQDGEQKDE